ncbi:Beta-galactosidase 6 [Nowakowskiella sp. JEL0407]|nr:Beta-galactosidase 6 [Nowakowskiella sp. JEL0407]
MNLNNVNGVVTYDKRGITINGKKEVMFVASIHYPRSDASQWKSLLQRSKEAGVQTIDTYVFWGHHEEREGTLDFETGFFKRSRLIDVRDSNEHCLIFILGNKNLPLFLKLAKDAGLHVVLRIGPYVCAEYTFGGFPPWLYLKKGLEIRTYNSLFMKYMENWVKNIVNVIKPYTINNGGPVIMLQMENEYGAYAQWWNFPRGHFYIHWAADLARRMDVGIPWFMCEQGDINSLINTYNGHYAESRIESHFKRFPNQPAMFTELWMSWFTLWGEAIPKRSAEDVAYASARFIAYGGSYVCYYMFHGGTNFARNPGGPWLTTSYDYDASLDEYGFRHPTKFYHFKNLHEVILKYNNLIVNNEPLEIHKYGSISDSSRSELYFLSNTSPSANITVSLSFLSKPINYVLPAWSVSIALRRMESVSGAENEVFEVLYNTATVTLPETIQGVKSINSTGCSSIPSQSNCTSQPTSIRYILEELPSETQIQNSNFSVRPLNQLPLTIGKTDYTWYISDSFELPTQQVNGGSVKVDISPLPSDYYTIYLSLKTKSGETKDFMVTQLDYPKKQEWDVGGLLGSWSIKNWFSSGSWDVKSDGVKVDEVKEYRVKILCVSMGIPHWGNRLERVWKGLASNTVLRVGGKLIGGWHHVVGLQGEEKKYFTGAAESLWKPIASPISELSKKLVWYQITLGVPSPQNATKFTNDTLLSTVLDLGTMGKGFVWIGGTDNLFEVGKYWLIKANWPEKDCVAKHEFIGGTYDSSKREGCGSPTQRFYHIPYDVVLKSKDERGNVTITLFEEIGGDPTGVKLVLLAG